MWLLSFCFFKQKTASEMRISDWSSDVCSSDLRRVKKRGLDLVLDHRRLFLDDQNFVMTMREGEQRLTRQGPAHRHLVDGEAKRLCLGLSTLEVGERLHQILVGLAPGHDAQKALPRPEERRVAPVRRPAPADRRALGRGTCRGRVC